MTVIVLSSFFTVFSYIGTVDSESKYQVGWWFIAIFLFNLTGNFLYVAFETFILIKVTLKKFLYGYKHRFKESQI